MGAEHAMVGMEVWGMVGMVNRGMEMISLPSFSRTFPMVLEKWTWLRYSKNGQG